MCAGALTHSTIIDRPFCPVFHFLYSCYKVGDIKFNFASIHILILYIVFNIHCRPCVDIYNTSYRIDLHYESNACHPCGRNYTGLVWHSG